MENEVETTIVFIHSFMIANVRSTSYVAHPSGWLDRAGAPSVAAFSALKMPHRLVGLAWSKRSTLA